MIVVTGGAGFIGSNVAARLNDQGRDDLVIVDELSDQRKVANVAALDLADYLDRTRFAELVEARSKVLDDVTMVIHQGASSSTTEPDGNYVIASNYEYTKHLVDYCRERAIPLVYASSAAVYGRSETFTEDRRNEVPLNVYGWSKFLVDNYVRRVLPGSSSQIVGLRYFNVYGRGEDHKDDMASIVTQLDNELARSGTATIFGASHGVGPGQQRRDFISVDDVVNVILWFAEHPDRSGIFNCGTGASATFETVARAVIAFRGHGELVYRDLPDDLADRYQPSTQADLTRLRAAGYAEPFAGVGEGVATYLAQRGVAQRSLR